MVGQTCTSYYASGRFVRRMVEKGFFIPVVDPCIGKLEKYSSYQYIDRGESINKVGQFQQQQYHVEYDGNTTVVHVAYTRLHYFYHMLLVNAKSCKLFL